MNRPSGLEKLKNAKKASPERLVAWGVGAILLALVGYVFHSRTRSAAPTTAQAAPHGILATYEAAFESVQTKATEIQHALEENQRLRYENDNLRLKLESARFDCREKFASAESAELGGATRTIASIGYHIPDNLLPGQLYTLAVTYFKAGEYDKVAVIMSQLTSMQDNTAFETARNYLMTGVTWYRLGNYDLANQYFDKTLAESETDENLPFQAQARLWKGLVAKDEGNAKASQHWLRELVDHHPHSMEASWINSTEAERVPASSH